MVTGAAGGKHHTLVCTSKGEAYSWGHNKCGQLGTGSLKVKGADNDVCTLPVKAAVSVRCSPFKRCELTPYLHGPSCRALRRPAPPASARSPAPAASPAP